MTIKYKTSNHRNQSTLLVIKTEPKGHSLDGAKMSEEIKEQAVAEKTEIGMSEKQFEEEIGTWDEAIQIGNFVKIEEDKRKVLKITKWKLVKKLKQFESDESPVARYEFIASVLEEDGKPVSDRMMSSTSNRMKLKLRPILEGKDANSVVKIGIIKMGSGYDTKYSIEEIVE